MTEYYLQLQNMSVGYHGKPLIRDIQIGIEKGEIVTLIGPNGAGKSTILKSITRQLSLIRGDVSVESLSFSKLSYHELAKKMSVVLTDRMKTDMLTCHDIVAAGRYPYTGRFGILTEEDEKKVEEALKIVHAENLGNQDFNKLSDGQRQRVLLARAICQEPEIMILDEPTSFLDIHYKLELLSILGEMARTKKITVIMSLHEIDLAQKISDKIMCVKGEYIFRYGTPEEIFQDNLIRELYEIDNGYFDSCFGSTELPKVEGKPRVLVLSSGGKGIPVYRRLQKQGIPFAAGILYRNDIDYQLARLLAVQVIEEEPFQEISDETYMRAVQMVKECEYVLDAGFSVGVLNQKMQQIKEMAEQEGKLRN